MLEYLSTSWLLLLGKKLSLLQQLLTMMTMFVGSIEEEQVEIEME